MWFPSGFTGTSYIEGDAYVEVLKDKLNNRTTISRDTITRILTVIFDSLGHWSFAVDSGPRSQVWKLLEEEISTDIKGAHFYERDIGLFRSRRTFVALANLAHMTNSVLLAETLMDFCYCHLPSIMAREKPYLLSKEWEPALRKVQKLVQSGMYNDYMPTRWDDWYHADPYEDWYRGRRHRHRLPYSWNHRTISAPPVRRRRSSPEMSLILPAHGMVARTPPMMSPVRMIAANPFDEVDMIQMNQMELASEIQHLRRDVDLLKWKY
jgi:hypothetical protein